MRLHFYSDHRIEITNSMIHIQVSNHLCRPFLYSKRKKEQSIHLYNMEHFLIYVYFTLFDQYCVSMSRCVFIYFKLDLNFYDFRNIYVYISPDCMTF